mmetsp:Transcript_37874/g.118672  ORF Transcript_37874/g.118672 Transcript_37874/m.118672 type:complete len:395 (-) Transcript_37874:1881-3065(-)
MASERSLDMGDDDSSVVPLALEPEAQRATESSTSSAPAKRKRLRSMRKAFSKATGASGFFSGKGKKKRGSSGADNSGVATAQESPALQDAPESQAAGGWNAERRSDEDEAETKPVAEDELSDDGGLEHIASSASAKLASTSNEPSRYEDMQAYDSTSDIGAVADDDEAASDKAVPVAAAAVGTASASASKPPRKSSSTPRSFNRQPIEEVKAAPATTPNGSTVNPMPRISDQTSDGLVRPSGYTGSFASSLDVNSKALLTGDKLAAAVDNIRVKNVQAGWFAFGKPNVYDVQLPSRLCRFLTSDNLPTDYLTVSHDYDDFKELNLILAATVRELPELPNSPTGGCFSCATGGEGDTEHAALLREYLSALFQLQPETLEPVKAPLSAFFGVSDEL